MAEKTTEKAQWMLEGSHGMARDADAAVALLEEKVKDRDAEAMWMLGVCCEFGMGTEQDVDRAEQLYKRGAEQGNATAEALDEILKSRKGRGSTFMDLRGSQKTKPKKSKQENGKSNQIRNRQKVKLKTRKQRF